MMVPPHTPVEPNVKGWLAAAPPATSAPKDCGVLGDTTPFVCNSVTTRFVVLPRPVFFKEKSIVTVSPGSIALFVGVQPSTTRLVESRTTTGSLFTKTVKLLVALNVGEPLSVTTVLNRFVLRS